MRKRPVLSIKYFGLSNVKFGDKVCLFVLFKKILGKYIGEYLCQFLGVCPDKVSIEGTLATEKSWLTEDKEQSDE